MKILYVSGGSGGHLSPLIAVERAVKQLNKEALSYFLCSDKPEDAAQLRHERVEFTQVPMPRRTWKLPFLFLQNYRMSTKVLKEWKPDAVFSKGGAVSVPACLAAYRMKIPVILHESDAVMGRANTMVAKWATKVCLGFPTAISSRQSAGSRTPAADRLVITGNPIRPQVTQGNREEGLRITGLTGTRPVLLVWGGSQGAESLNTAVRAHIDELLQVCDIIHLTGKGKKGATAREGYWSAEFSYAELPHLLAASDMALGRAGASTISELAATGIPAVLVPIRGLANDHQMRNATMAQENGGCILLLQEDLDKKLVEVISELARNSQRREKIAQSMKKLFQPDASGQIAKIIVQCVA